MVDIVGIGVSGLTTYQRSLATTGNNIANLQTEGYVRQRSIIESAGQDTTSRISLGAGVRFAGVERVYDRFAEENLRRATSELSSQESLLRELQALQDTIGSSEAGLHGAFEEFFGAVRGLEVAPASVGARAGFVAAADGVALRFRNLGSTIADFDRFTREAIEDSVTKANSLLRELASLNTQLANKGSSADQPMQLLDKRDAMIGRLAEQMGVTVVFADNGISTIYAGESASGAALVENGVARSLTATFDAVDPGRVQFVLDAQSRPTVLPPVRSGAVGGLVSYRSQALGIVADRLDTLALRFGNEVNKLHREGLDSQGRPGGDIFYVGPDFDVEGGANAGSTRLGVEVVDADAVGFKSYDARYDANRAEWTVTERQSNRSASGASAVELDGLRFTFNGTPASGDTFRVTPAQRPSQTFATLIREPDEIVTGMRLSIAGSLSNLSGISADVTLAPQRDAGKVRSLADALPKGVNPGSVATSFSATTKPIAVIEAGMKNVILRAESANAELAIFTRDGRQIAGPAMSSSVVTTANGFFAGAEYSSTYRNRSDSAAYLDQGFTYGAYVASGSQDDGAGGKILTPATLLTNRIDTSAFTQLASGTLRINGQALTTKIPLDATPVVNTVAEYAAAINTRKTTTGVVAEAKSELRLTPPSTSGSLSVTINGRIFSAANVSTLMTLINADTSLPTIEARLEGALRTNGSAIVEGSDIVLTDTTGAAIDLGNNSFGVEQKIYGAQLLFRSYQQIAVSPTSIPLSANVVINGVTIQRTAPGSDTATQRASGLASAINAASLGVTAEVDTVSGNLVLRNADGRMGEPFTIGTNNLGIDAKQYFNDKAISIDFDSQISGASSSSLRQLGLQPGFVMRTGLAEDLLVFGVDSSGVASAVSLTGSYDAGTPPVALAPDRREFRLVFADGSTYSIIDSATQTTVASGVFDPAERTLRYGNWKVTMGGVPSNGDTFVIKPNEDPRGDNRMAAAIARIQDRKDLLGNDQTVQQEYENIVDRVGALAVQAEIGRDATRTVKDHAREARERVSGVNLDEELADLLRYQQAYQANAQVIQAASRIFDALLQRL
ncbi:MAG: flagellar hook-associated protein FlgK [Nevskiaceae bacterium]